jgi:hypothetical protein
MIEIVALALAAILLAISALHFYWAFGGVWPGSDEASLSSIVVGQAPSKSGKLAPMPNKLLTLLVAIAILVAAFFPIMWAGLIIPYPLHASLVMIGMWVLAAIFLLRGLVGLVPLFDRFSPAEPFRTLNRKYYSPFCILIGLGFTWLIYAATH